MMIIIKLFDLKVIKDTDLINISLLTKAIEVVENSRYITCLVKKVK